MTDIDYQDPKFHLLSRGRINADLIDGLFPIERSEWGNYRHFQEWPMHVLRLHRVISDACNRLIKGFERILDGSESGSEYLIANSGMAQLGLDLVAHVHHHHNYEDVNVLPGFMARFPQLTNAIDLLEKDHVFLNDTLYQSEVVFAQLRRKGAGKMQIDKALEQAKILSRILTLHTEDEEDVLIPAVLDAYS
ncbi:hemerythrin domain-containing protein [Cochlodiniinecator piscidefendens]|uniref:hemerythrin domain-containing protein n=1 Tax=Cochlodiniinecator piscidefendens TaxID=2715756 RepID=UPI00140876D3|nr:hemerythrin domain-containing protein [Cochlodiniinecator piscidefendens]